MKRVGKRGEGKFKRISWEEAYSEIAVSLQRIVAKYGNEAVYINYTSGIVGGNITRSSPYASLVARLMKLLRWFSQPLWHLQHRPDRLRHALYPTAAMKVTAPLILKTASWWCCSATIRRKPA
ncbi:Dimethyl sulfoxide reductase DmsA precursor [Serratia fonticola]|uniref:Dimethyl sulfoxide reductase DmsA n=1 Tax=Serratia fonticola TaxID=47917 RepID=A0A4U9V6N7_SERFO|nr:Dimethyl sulfoxide reductase DmsA precursor [Serratia fonticola]